MFFGISAIPANGNEAFAGFIQINSIINLCEMWRIAPFCFIYQLNRSSLRWNPDQVFLRPASIGAWAVLERLHTPTQKSYSICLVRPSGLGI